MSDKIYDIAIIGAGPGGEVAAIRAAQLGMRVALIDKGKHLGGTCLNVGCIPTKALIASANFYLKIKAAADYGFNCKQTTFVWEKILARKNKIVDQQRRGLQFLMQKNKIDLHQGVASLKSTTSLSVQKQNKTETLKCKNLLIASGSRVMPIPASIKTQDSPAILTSDTILDIKAVPASLAVIGGGIVGMEFACLFNAFGCKVSVYEVAPTVLANEDEEVVAFFSHSCQKQQIKLHCDTKVSEIQANKQGVKISTAQGEQHPYEKVLLAMGRVPTTSQLKLEVVGVQLTESGHIPVDTSYRLAGQQHLYAIGDAIDTPALAHTASAEAMQVVETIAGKNPTEIDYTTNPNAIYTIPEIASIGDTEQVLREKGIEYKKVKYPFTASAKAKIDDCTEGFIKILFGAKHRELLGVHIINAKATELIAELLVAKGLEATLDEIAKAIHPHPTIAETVMETAHAGVYGALHL